MSCGQAKHHALTCAWCGAPAVLMFSVYLLREAVGVVQSVNVRALQPVGGDDKNVNEDEVVLKQLELDGGGHIGRLRKLSLEEEGCGEEEDKPQGEVGVEGEYGGHGKELRDDQTPTT